MKKAKIMLIAAALLVGSVMSAGAAVVYSENFDSGTSGWISYMTGAWTPEYGAYTADAFGGGAAFWSIQNSVIVPSNWEFTADVTFVSAYHGGDPNYGNAGLLLSSTNGPADNPLSGDWVVAIATRSTYMGTVYLGIFLDSYIGGVSGHQWSYCNTGLTPSDKGPYYLTATRAPGTNDIVASLYMPTTEFTTTLTQTLTAPQADNLKYMGLTAYYSLWQVDNVKMTTIPPVAGSIAGTVTLSDFGSGNVNLAPVQIDVFAAGTTTPVVASKTVFATRSVDVTSASYEIPELAVGSYDVYFNACKWLRKAAIGQTVNSNETTTIDVSLLNGDLDGDNEVTSTDLSILGLNLGIQGD